MDIDYLSFSSEEIFPEPDVKVEPVSRSNASPIILEDDSDNESDVNDVVEITSIQRQDNRPFFVPEPRWNPQASGQRQPVPQQAESISVSYIAPPILLSDDSDIETHASALVRQFYNPMRHAGPTLRAQNHRQPTQQQTTRRTDGNIAAPVIIENNRNIGREVHEIVDFIPFQRNQGNYTRRRMLNIEPDPLFVRTGDVAAERNTTRPRKDQDLAPELAVSKEIVESFDLNGLKENPEDEITEIEEMVFQKVLRRKMVCDVCMTHMKLYRCRKCMYSMCQKCTDKLKQVRPGNAICPQCRESQQNFIQIVLPRL